MANSVDAFVEELRHALRRFYDPAYMRSSPLLRAFGLEDAANPAERLRDALRAAIDSFQADDADHLPPGARRCYQVLHYRYVQQFTQRDVASQLHISPRQLRRDQTRAIDALAQTLRAQLSLSADLEAQLEGGEDAASGEGPSDVDGEFTWLGDSLSDEVSDLDETIEESLDLAAPVAERYGVRLRADLDEDMPLLKLSATVLKQIVLSILTPAIHCVPDGGQVALSTSLEEEGAILTVEATPAPGAHTVDPGTEALDMAQKLTGLFEGRFAATISPEIMLVRIGFPTADDILVLAIEDNLDALQLWERYAQGSRFQIEGLRDPRLAQETAIDRCPDIIVLDVMMPGLDGWELLGQLSHHPRTRDIPVVICTVLPQKELALTLGARGFIRKPMTRAEFLAELGRQIEA